MAKDNNTPQDVPISVNTFTQGMNKDISKYALPKDQYYDANNVRIVADSGKESGALVNIQGNEFAFEIPCSPNVFRLLLAPNINLIGIPWTSTISITVLTQAGPDTWSIALGGTGGSPVSALYQALKFPAGVWLLNGAASALGPSDIAGQPGFYWIFDASSQAFVIWGKPNSTFETYVPGVTVPDVNYVNQVSTISESANFTTISVLSGQQCAVSIIGYAVLRDQIILFTTSIDGGSEEAIGGAGQLWKLNVVENTNSFQGIQSFVECVYARDQCINFTKQHPIEAIARYEKIDIQGVYWTDNFNAPRKLNISGPTVMSTPCAFLDLAPKVGFTIPILDSITIGGQLLSGVYQLTYRYKNTEGIVSDWSPLSNMVPIYESADLDPYCQIGGGEFDMATLTGDLTGKRIKWILYNLDISFEFIELAAVYRDDNIPGNEKIYIFNTLTNGVVDLAVEHTGSEDFIPMSLIEFTTGIGATFERVKTLSSKDNKLFFGNVVNTTFNVDYDSRSYRFDSGQLALLDSSILLPAIINGAALYTPGAGQTAINLVPEEHDCINPYNDENPATNANWFTSDQYTFQADGNTLGGTGANISYKFIKQVNEEDEIETTSPVNNTITTFVNPFFTDYGDCTTTQVEPNRACFYHPEQFSLVSFIATLGVPDQNYDLNRTWENYKSPYKWSLYGAYARGETYRFGIVFYNNKGQSSFVNWIGDIKIPFSYSTGLGTPLGFFQVSTWVPNIGSTSREEAVDSYGTLYTWDDRGKIYTNNIGIEFTVNLDPATSGIDVNKLGITGYSIVRVDRTEDDKSKFGHGISHTCDRLEMISSQWSNMINPMPNYWGGSTSQDIIIPSCGGYYQRCGGPILNYCDASTGNAGPMSNNGGQECTLMPWRDGVFPYLDTGYHLCKTRKTEILLYGPLGWKNSDSTNTGNLNEGLGVSQKVSKGDYMKVESVMMPMYNIGMRMGEHVDSFSSGVTTNWRSYRNHYYKYYYGTNIKGGIFGSSPAALTFEYTEGIPSNNSGQDPANSKLYLDWGTHVGDGLYIPPTEDVSLEFGFRNATHPGGETSLSIYSPATNWISSRPRSIGSECFLFTFDVLNPWEGSQWLMGASLDLFGTSVSFPNYRAIFSYERYVVPYGGNTFANRSNNTYMSTGHFYPITTATWLGAPIVFDVWGGDVQCQLWDYTQFEKNWGQSEFDNYDSLVAGGWSMGTFDNSLDNEWGIQINCIFPTETHMNNSLYRYGYHFNNRGGAGNSYPDNGTNLHDEYTMMSAYHVRNNVKSYFPRPLYISLGEEFDARVYYSETKINGEANDQWAVFLQYNYKDVEGVYGPINKLIRLHDTIYYFQNTGFGSLSVNPTAMVQSASGTALQLGTVGSGAGDFIQSFTYLSTIYGSKQQWSVTHSDNALYFFDINQRKLFTYGGKGTTPVSDITGLHSYFQDNLIGNILVKDNPILKEGISCTYDSDNNEVLFTFHDKGYNQAFPTPIISIGESFTTPNRVLEIILRPGTQDGCNDCFNQDCEAYDAYTPGGIPNNWIILDNILINGDGPFSGVILGRYGCDPFLIPIPNPQNLQIGDVVIWIPEVWNNFPSGIQPGTHYDDININNALTLTTDCGIGETSFTIAYNELVRGFTSFYDFHPSIYINSGSFFITPNTQHPCMTNSLFGDNQLYIHGYGTYGRFYDMIYQSSVTLCSNLNSSVTKVFDNVSYHMESLWIEGRQTESFADEAQNIGTNSGIPVTQLTDIPNNTFNKIRFYTDYQMTDYVNLVPGKNVRKKEREWQMQVPRNIMNENLVNADIFNAFNYNPGRLFKDRMRDKYLFIDLVYDNFDTEVGEPKNIKFILHYFKTFFRPSFR